MGGLIDAYPNVFNICTLRETKSTLRKRQEIGRGMRLCVNQDGERIFSKEINLLSIIANESYAEYVSNLQSQLVEEGVYNSPPLPYNAKHRRTLHLKENSKKDEDFNAIWRKISKKTHFWLVVNTEQLIKDCGDKIQSLHFDKPKITIERAGVDFTREAVEAVLIGAESQDYIQEKHEIDCVELIKNETKLTRETVISILNKANNTAAFLNDPSKFCFESIKIIKDELIKHYIGKIRYEIISDKYQIEQFKDILSYEENTQSVTKSIYDAIEYDSEIEKKFANMLDRDERVKLFIKLPGWFKIDTPVGGYVPDWAIVTVRKNLKGKAQKQRIYFIIETKGDTSNLRQAERAKIESAKKHFAIIEVRYKEIENYDQFKLLLNRD